MEITGVRPDWSLDAEVEFADGALGSTLEIAHQLAVDHKGVIHFRFNDRPIAVGPDTDCDRLFETFMSPGCPRDVEIGPDLTPGV